jgi:hypothetical protein
VDSLGAGRGKWRPYSLFKRSGEGLGKTGKARTRIEDKTHASQIHLPRL